MQRRSTLASYRIFSDFFPFQNDEEPLNSDDDIDDGDSDEEGGGDFETEDTIVCQWEKVRSCKGNVKFCSLLVPRPFLCFQFFFFSGALKKTRETGDETI